MGTAGNEPIRPLEEILLELGHLTGDDAWGDRADRLQTAALTHPECSGRTLVEFITDRKKYSTNTLLDDGWTHTIIDFANELIINSELNKGLLTEDYLAVAEIFDPDDK